jgi:hypothetical protein
MLDISDIIASYSSCVMILPEEDRYCLPLSRGMVSMGASSVLRTKVNIGSFISKLDFSRIQNRLDEKDWPVLLGHVLSPHPVSKHTGSASKDTCHREWLVENNGFKSPRQARAQRLAHALLARAAQ